ncbi:flavin reductase family protein [Alteribacillus sp. YIM 98480]|uniref:flavin reductase family protein n=1 Tax=Alteribacillus sp. YIM 98480 TaxID=2606599 RepID=UPI00131E96EE|nr:flavin reductase family protein [Alteribacillus sp. YIM 98480]
MPDHNVYTFNPDDLKVQDMYKLLIGSVVPRPIAWVSSKSQDRILNLAPFSFFTVASPCPPTLAISIAPGNNNNAKDTLTNIRDTKEYVINIVPEHLGSPMYISSKSFPAEIDEFQQAGLTPQPALKINAPMVKESPIAFELKLDQILPIGVSHFVLGKVVHIHVHKDIYVDSYKTDIEKWKPLARLAGDYASITTPYSLPRE